MGQVSGVRSPKNDRRWTWVGEESTLPGRVCSVILGDREPRFSGGFICPIEGNFKVTTLDFIIG